MTVTVALLLAASVSAFDVPFFDSTLKRIFGGPAPGNLAAVRFEKADWPDDQKYEIVSSDDAVVVRAAGANGAAYGASRILRELGWRRFAPHPSWEFLPDDPPRMLKLNVVETPDFRMRCIWPEYGLWPAYRKNGEREAWEFYSRLGGDVIQCNHVYQGFVRQEKAFLEAHPECLALVGGERKGDKLCISNPLLRERFADFTVRALEKSPGLKAVTVEPSDGGGWCECEECAKIGSPSDLAITLANAAVTRLRMKFPGRKVALYAYNLHSPPPAVAVDRDVIVLVATAFNRGGWTPTALASAWGKKAAIGVREYYFSPKGEPGCGAAADAAYIAKSIPGFHALGARYLTAEADESWAPALMGFNVAAELMWNVKADAEVVKREIVQLAFPSAPEEMGSFFELIDRSSGNPLTDDLLARMRDALSVAWTRAKTPAERERVAQMLAYARYAARLMRFGQTGREKEAVALCESAAVLKPYGLVPTYVFFRDPRPFGKVAAGVMKRFDWETKRPIDPEGALAELAPFERLDFEPKDFGLDLIPAKTLAGRGECKLKNLRGTNAFHLWSDGRPFEVGVTGGLITWYRDRGNVRISLVQIGGESETGELETRVYHDVSVPPDGIRHVVRIVPRRPGLHRLEVVDGGDCTKYDFPSDLPIALAVGPGQFAKGFAGNFWFVVPKGVRKLGFYAQTIHGAVCGPDGKSVFDLKNRTGHFSVDVPEGADGCVWEVRNMQGVFRPLTVPSVLSINPGHLLLPKGVEP